MATRYTWDPVHGEQLVSDDGTVIYSEDTATQPTYTGAEQTAAEQTATQPKTFEQAATEYSQQVILGIPPASEIAQGTDPAVYQILDPNTNEPVVTVHQSAIDAGAAATYEEVASGEKSPPAIVISQMPQFGKLEQAGQSPSADTIDTITDPQTGKSYDRQWIMDNYVPEKAPTKTGYQIKWDQLRMDEAHARVYTLMEQARTNPNLNRESAISQISATGNEYEKQALKNYLKSEGQLMAEMVKSGIKKDDAQYLVTNYSPDVAVQIANQQFKAQVDVIASKLPKDDKTLKYWIESPDYVIENRLIKNKYDLRESIEKAILHSGTEGVSGYRKAYDNIAEKATGKPGFPSWTPNKDERKLIWDSLSDDMKSQVLEEYRFKHIARIEKPILDWLPITSTYRAAHKHGWKSGWTWLSLGGDAALLTAPLIKAGSVVTRKISPVSAGTSKSLKTIQSELNNARKATVKDIDAIAKTGRYNDDLIDSMKTYTNDRINYMEALNLVEKNKIKLINSLNKLKPAKLNETKKAIDSVTETALSTSYKAEVGSRITDLVPIGRSNIKLSVNDLEKSITHANNMGNKLAESSNTLANKISVYSSQTEGAFAQTKIKAPPKPKKSTKLTRRDELAELEMLTGKTIKYADIGFSGPDIKGTLLNLLKNDPVSIARNEYRGIVTQGRSLDEVERELSKLRNTVKTKQLSDYQHEKALDRIRELEKMRLELKVRETASSSKVGNASDRAGLLQRRLNEVNQKIKDVKEGKAYTSEITTEEQLKMLEIQRDVILNDINEAVTLGMYDIYKAGGRVKETGIGNISVAPTSASTVNFLVSRNLIGEIPGLKLLPKSRDIVKRLSAARDSANPKLLKEAAIDLYSEASRLPNSPEKTILLKEAAYIEKNADDLAEMIRTSLEGNQAHNLDNLKNELKVAERKYRNTKSPKLKPKLKEYIERTKKKVKLLEDDPMHDVKTSVMNKILMDAAVAGKYLPVTIDKKKGLKEIEKYGDAGGKVYINNLVVSDPDYAAIYLSTLSSAKARKLYSLLSPANKEKISISPFIVEVPTPIEETETDVDTTIRTSTETETKTDTETKVKPEPFPFPEPIPVPTPVPEPEPMPYIEDETKEKKRATEIFLTGRSSQKKLRLPPFSIESEWGKSKPIPSGTVTFRMGEVGSIENRVPVWWLIPPPYNKIYYQLKVPAGAKVVNGPRSAYNTIQTLGNKPPSELLTIDMGAMDIRIDSPDYPGEEGAIQFIPDRKQRTTSDLRAGNINKATPSAIRAKTYKPKPKKKKTKLYASNVDAYVASFWK